jgi:ribosomal protein S18 acetylase RimI-like enzyme
MADERDIMLRDMAQHRGFKLVKSRRRKPGGDFGRYGLTDAATGQDCFGIGREGLEASFEAVETYLRGKANATWKQSLGTAGEAAKPAPAKKRVEAEPVPPPKKKPVREKPAPPPEPEPEPELKPEPVPPEPEPEPALIVRDARIGDAAAMAALLGMAEGELAASLRQLIQAGQAPLVAEQGEAVGCAAWHLIPMLGGPAPLGRISLLHVAEAHRRRGIGRALLSGAEQRLLDRGCAEVEVLSGIDVVNAHGFFRRLGYERTSYRFTRNPPFHP